MNNHSIAMKNFDPRTVAPRIQACMTAAWLALVAASAPAQSWFFNWDGTTDITCAPTVEGNNAYFQGGAANPNFYWEIVTNGSGGKAFRQVVSTNAGFRWYGYGSRPEFYRGPCTTFGMENFRPDRNAFTIAFRIKAENCTSTSSVRFFNCEFETTVPSPFWSGTPQEFASTGGSYGPYLGFRVEFALRKGSGDDVWLYDNRQGKDIYQLKANGQPAQWRTVWATCELPSGPPFANPFCIYRIWVDGTEVAWDDRDRNGWSDGEVGWTPTTSRNGTYALDYVCYTYGAYAPGTIPIPAERALAPTNSISALKGLADGTPCELANKWVMGIFTNGFGVRFYYVGETNGTDGIKVSHNTGKSPVNTGGSAVTLAVGDVVSLKGGLSSAECEKQISAHEIIRTSSGGTLPAPATVTTAGLLQSYTQALRTSTPTQHLAVAVTGTITAFTTNKLTDTSKTWATNQWKDATVYLPQTAGHTNLYYYVISNSVDTLILAHRAIRVDFTNQPNLTAAGVLVGDSYEFAGGQPAGPRLDGLRVRTLGTVTAVNIAGNYFDINDGSASDEVRTLQDIWDRINYPSVWVPPAGLRVKWSGAMPTVGQPVSVRGCVGADRFKYQVATKVDPNNSERDEVKVDKAYPVVAADSFVLWSNPVFTSPSLTPTGFVANVAVVPGEPYRLRASTNLQTWVDVTNFVAAGPSYIVLDPGATNQPLRFYRVESP